MSRPNKLDNPALSKRNGANNDFPDTFMKVLGEFKRVDRIAFSVLSFTFCVLSFVYGDISFTGLNRGEVRLENTTGRFFLRDRLDFDLLITNRINFRFGGRFDVDESTWEDTLVFTGFRQRFVQYQGEPLNLILGNFYETFGQGIVLGTKEDELLRLDQNIDGLKVEYEKEEYGLTGIIGRPLKDILTQERKELIIGLSGQAKPFENLGLNGSYLRFNAGEKISDPLFGLAVEERFGFGPDITLWNFLQISGEYARRLTWGKFDPGYGWVGTDNVNGSALWVSLNFAFSGLGIGLEGKRYKNFDGDFNNPPATGKTNRLINKGKDETGFRLETNFSPLSKLNLLISFDRSWAQDTNQHLQLFLIEPRVELGRIVLRPYYQNQSERAVIPAYPQKRENLFGLEFILGNFSLLSEFTIGRDTSSLGRQNYREIQVTPSFGYAFFNISFTMDWTNKKDPVFGPGGFFYWSGIRLDFGNHQTIFYYGKRRGKLECSGGYCRFEPGFNGFKLEVTNRF